MKIIFQYMVSSLENTRQGPVSHRPDPRSALASMGEQTDLPRPAVDRRTKVGVKVRLDREDETVPCFHEKTQSGRGAGGGLRIQGGGAGAGDLRLGATGQQPGPGAKEPRAGGQAGGRGQVEGGGAGPKNRWKGEGGPGAGLVPDPDLERTVCS